MEVAASKDWDLEGQPILIIKYWYSTWWVAVYMVEVVLDMVCLKIGRNKLGLQCHTRV